MVLPEPMTAEETAGGMLQKPIPVLRVAGATDVGREREHNEDGFWCMPEHGVFGVVDGVGGYAAGEVASALAVESVSKRLCLYTATPAERMRVALYTANKRIHYHSTTVADQRGMACVLTAIVVEGGTVTVGHVGDTRLYEVHRDGICKITRDHSVVGIREDQGELSEWEAMTHPRRNEILRDLGSEPWPDDADTFDLYDFAFAADRALVLCSDGLTDLVPSVALHQVVVEHAGHPEKSVAALIELANRAGGYDNITVVVIEGEHFEGAVPMQGVAPAGAALPPVNGGWHRALIRKLKNIVLL